MKFCLNGGLLLGTVDGANIEIAEEVGESNVCEFNLVDAMNALFTSFPVFFGHLTPAVEDLRYQHVYHPIPVEQKCPRLAAVLSAVASGTFGDAHIYDPFVPKSGIWTISNDLIRLLNTIRQSDYYLLTDDFDSCSYFFDLLSASLIFYIDLAAIDMVDEAYADRDSWIKKSISTTAKVSFANYAAC